jgi:hypothetical protein
LQVSRAADPETLQSQLAKTARKRLSLSSLELLHGRLDSSACAGLWGREATLPRMKAAARRRTQYERGFGQGNRREGN